MASALYISNPLGGGHAWLSWLFYTLILEMLLVLFVIDLKHFILPDKILLTILVIFLAYMLIGTLTGINDPLQQVITLKSRALGIAIFGGILFLLWLLSKGRAVGLGDAKFLSVLALIFGLRGTLVIFYSSLIVGMVFGIVMLLFNLAGLKSKLPFGTFLAGSASLYIFTWQKAIDYLNNLFLKAFT